MIFNQYFLGTVLGLPPDECLQFANLVLEMDQRDSPPVLLASDLVSLAIYADLRQRVQVSPIAAVRVLQEMQPFLQEVGWEMGKVYDEEHVTEGDLPAFRLQVADGQYVTWTGEDRFFDVQAGRWIDQLPRLPVWGYEMLVHVAYHRLRQVLDRKQEGQDVQHAQGTAGVHG